MENTVDVITSQCDPRLELAIQAYSAVGLGLTVRLHTRAAYVGTRANYYTIGNTIGMTLTGNCHIW